MHGGLLEAAVALALVAGSVILHAWRPSRWTVSLLLSLAALGAWAAFGDWILRVGPAGDSGAEALMQMGVRQSRVGAAEVVLGAWFVLSFVMTAMSVRPKH